MINSYEPFDPLKQPVRAEDIVLKRTIENIFDSYHGDYDVLIELVQNAVDALEEHYSDYNGSEKPTLLIEINQQTNTISVFDNGIGIKEENARRILTDSYSGKSGRRGHKGVGLTYVAYISNNFRLCTKKDNKIFTGELSNAMQWVRDKDNKISRPLVKPVEYYPDFLKKYTHGSCFEVRLDSTNFPSGNLTWPGWEFILRNKTAIGYCNLDKIPDWIKKVKIRLRVINNEGIKLEPKVSVPFKYLFPHDIVAPNTQLTNILKKYASRADVPNSEKFKYKLLFDVWNSKAVKEELITSKDETKRSEFLDLIQNHNIKVYGAFSYSSDIWKEEMISKYSNDKRLKFWIPGVHFLTENMPVGNPITVSLPFAAGNKDRVYIVIEGSNIKPDTGRKSFPRKYINLAQEIAKNVVTEFITNRILFIPTSYPHGPSLTEQELSIEELKRKVAALPPLGLEDFAFVKEPRSEQDVVALFHEILGKKIIKGFKILSVYQGEALYDSIVIIELKKDENYVLYDSKNVIGVLEDKFSKGGKIKTYEKILEFKYFLTDLIKDCERENKNFKDIDFVVVWDLGEKEAFAPYEITNLIEGSNYGKRRFHGITHLLHYTSGSPPINVINLKTIIKLLSENKILF